MARRRKKKNKKRTELDPYEVVEERVSVTAHELIQLIHRVNPTNENVSSEEAFERYQLKSRLQINILKMTGP